MAAPAQRQTTVYRYQAPEQVTMNGHQIPLNPENLAEASRNALFIESTTEEECPVCQEPVCEISTSNRSHLYAVIPNGEEPSWAPSILKLGCNHYFHVSCCHKWQDRSVTHERTFTCPSCREEVTPESMEYVPGRIFNATKSLWKLMRFLQNAPTPWRTNPDLENSIIAAVEQGALTNIQDIKGNSLVHHAVHGCIHTLIRSLIDHKANVNIRNTDGNTPLHKAVAQRCLECVTCLRTNQEGEPNLDIDLNIQNRQGAAAEDLLPVEHDDEVIVAIRESLRSIHEVAGTAVEVATSVSRALFSGAVIAGQNNEA